VRLGKPLLGQLFRQKLDTPKWASEDLRRVFSKDRQDQIVSKFKVNNVLSKVSTRADFWFNNDGFFHIITESASRSPSGF
jgi:hypothetical protein